MSIDLVYVPHSYDPRTGYGNACLGFIRALCDMHFEVLSLEMPLHNAETGGLPAGLRRQVVMRVRRFPFSGFFDQIRFGLAIARAMKQYPSTVVLVETLEMQVALATAVLRSPGAGRHLVVRVHGCAETEWFVFGSSIRWRAQKRIARFVVNRLSALAATSNYYNQFVRRHYLDNNPFLTDKSFFVLPNTSQIPTGEASGASGSVLFLTLGRMDKMGCNQKNFHVVLNGLYALKQRHADEYKEVECIFVGAGAKREALREEAKQLGVEERCTFIERLENHEIRKLQRRAHCAVLVSRYEGHSMFFAECQAAGLPVIVSRGTALEEFVVEGVNGYTVDPYDYAELCCLMREFIVQKGMISRKCVQDRFLTTCAPERIAALVRELCDIVKARKG